MSAAIDPTTAGAAAIINAQLQSWGIYDLAPDVLRILQQGLGPAAVLTELENTNSYKTRFAANDERRKKGLRVLPPAEYVATETQLKGVLRTFGMPAGFYDSNEDMRKFLANDVSPAELQDRAQVAQTIWLTGPQENRDAWKQYYGLGDGAAIAAILNPDKAVGLIQKQAAAAQLGGTAARQGLDVARNRAEDLVGQGVSLDQARTGYGQIGEALGTDQAIAQRFGDQLTQTDEEDARLLGLASARRKIQGLQASETSLFSGHGTAGSGALTGVGTGSY